MKRERLLQFVILTLLAYIIFKVPGIIMGKPIPSSVIQMYMFFVVVTILLVMTATEDSAERLFRPIKAVASGQSPSMRRIRAVLFLILPIFAAYLTYLSMRPSTDPPVELRSVHPAPPALMTAYGKTFDLSSLENPFRPLEKEDPAGFKALVSQGGEIYFKNCFFCHGDKLDGKGHYARALNPAPLPFQGGDTIAQLQESYVFWRIVKGGPGLPKEGGPAVSSMPAWEGMLAEEEVWKVMLFIYDYTGNTPRSWSRR